MVRMRVQVVALSLAVLVSTVAVGCGSGGGSDGSGSDGSSGSDEVTAGVERGHELTPRELTAALADAGIATLDGPGGQAVAAVTAPGPMQLTQDQVEVMARQTRDRSGTAGADVDRVVGPLEGAPPFSIVMAGYVKAGKTPGAKLSRRIMGVQPWAQAEQLVFPDVVLALFANDVAREGQEAKPAGLRSLRGGPPALRAVPDAVADDATGVCSSLASWVDGIIQTVVYALKVDTSEGGITGLLGDIWNTVVDLAVEAGGAALGALTAPVVGVIKKALAIAGTVSMVASLLRPWSVAAEQQPEPAQYGVEPGSGNKVAIQAKVDLGGSEPFSAGVIDCAKQAGIELPDSTSAEGSKIEWKRYGIDEVGTDVSEDGTVGKGNTAELRFTTKTESKEAAEKGSPVPHTTAVSISIERTKVKDLQKLLGTLLTGSLPGPAAPIVGAVFDLITQPIFDEMAALLGTGGSGSGLVISHEPPEPDKADVTTATTEGCEGEAGGAIPDGTFTGPITLEVGGDPKDASGTITSSGSGTMTITVAKGKVTGGSWKIDWQSSGTITMEGGSGTIESMTGHGDGTVSGPATAPVLGGQFSLNGSISVAVAGITTAVPIDESGSTTATLTVEESSCDEVGGTFIPSFNSATGGEAYFSGEAHWTGQAA